MKNLVITLTVLLLYSCCPTKHGSTTKPTPGSIGKVETYDLDATVKTIQKQYECALKQLEKEKIKDIEITSAELSLTVAKATSGSGELSVLIFTGSGSIEKSNSTGITFTLAKEDTAGGSVSALEENDNQLCDLIVATAKKFHGLKRTIGDLKKDSFELDIVFSIEKKGGGKVTFEIFGIGGEVGAERTGSVEHELKLTFKPIKP